MPLAHRITIEIILALASSGAPRSQSAGELEVAELRIDAASATHLPRISAELRGGIAPGSLVRIPDTEIFVSGQSALDRVAIQGRYGASIVVEQPLYDFGRSAAALDAARAARTAALADRQATREDQRTAAALAFYRWAAAVTVAETAEADVSEAREVRDRAHRLVEEGKRAPSDTDGPDADWLRAELSSGRARADAAAARHGLEALVGELAPDARPDVTEASGEVPSSEGQLDALRAHAGAARAEARVADRADRPVLGAIATLGVKGLDARLLPAWEAGVALSIPLFDRSARLPAREARARAFALEVRATELGEQRAAAVRAATDEVVYARARVDLAAQLVAASERTLAHVEELGRIRGDQPEQLARARADARGARLERDLAAIDAAAAGFRAHTPRRTP